MEHIKKFETESEYISVKPNLNYPCVSYVEETEKVNFKRQSKVISKFKITEDIINEYAENGELILLTCNVGDLKSYEINGVKYGPYEEPNYGDYVEKKVEFTQREDGIYVVNSDTSIKYGEFNTGIYFTFDKKIDTENYYFSYKVFYDGVLEDGDRMRIIDGILLNRIIYNEENNTISFTKEFCQLKNKMDDPSDEHMSIVYWVSHTPYNNELAEVETTQHFPTTITNEEKLSPSSISISVGELNDEIKLKTVYYDDVTNFGDFSKLVSYINLSSFSENNDVRIEDEKFLEYVNLEKIILGENTTYIGTSAFAYCSKLKKIDIPDSVIEIWHGAFEGCVKLLYANVGNGIDHINDNLFFECESLKEVVLNDKIESIYQSAFGGCKNMQMITLPNSLKYIYHGAFWGCLGLKELIIPESVKYIEDHAFCNCMSLTNITIPNSITEISISMFESCISLTSVTIPDSVTSIGKHAFDDCSNLTSVTIPNSVKSIDEYAFRDCDNLTSIEIPDSVTSLGNYAFSSCNNLTSITIGDSVTSISYNVFQYCRNITEIIISEGNTVYDSRENCNAIIKTSTNALTIGCKNTDIPNSVTSIDGYAFYECSGLTSIIIPDSVTTINSNAFYSCDNLTSVTIGSGIELIATYAFTNCGNLVEVTCKAKNSPAMYLSTFNNVGKNGTVYYPSGSDYSGWISRLPADWTIQEITA